MKFFGTPGFYETLKKQMFIQNGDIVQCSAVTILSF